MYDKDHTRLGRHDTETVVSTNTVLGQYHKMVIWDSILILSGCRPLGRPNRIFDLLVKSRLESGDGYLYFGIWMFDH